MSDKDIQLSRRKVLAGLGTIGVASAGAGLGTTAWLSDEESFLNNVFTAGTLDLLVDYEVYEYQGSAGSYHVSSIDDVKNGQDVDIPPVNGGDEISQELADVKPGDYGYSKFCFTIDTNPAYLWACGGLTANDENTVTEPEADVDPNNSTATETDIDGDGELADAIDVSVYYCDAGDDIQGDRPSDGDAPGDLITSGSLAEVLDEFSTGVALDGDGDAGAQIPDQAPFDGSGAESPDNPCLCFAWEVPTSVGNEIQSDSVAFDIVFHAIQSRHNDGSANPCASAGLQSCEGDAELPVSNDDMSLDAINNGATTTFTLTVPDGIFPDTTQPDSFPNHAELFLGNGSTWVSQVRYASGSNGQNVPIAGGSMQDNGGSWQALSGDWSASAGDDVVTFTVPNEYLRENGICSLGVSVIDVSDGGSTSAFLTPGGGRPWNGDMYVL